ncbi:hypothetical protein PAEPH01_2174 [Pancytospora epiphaga]|nr:hypothetical protein PAEPH01_2174 [Pancytospora epiphaga]
MPFGLTNAPRTFQRGMNKLLGDLPYVKIFLDDILVSSTSENIHAQHLIEVLKRLRKAKAQINFRKSSFYERRVTYLGHIIDQEGMRPDISRVNTFKQIQPPKTPKQLQHIIGFINWFRPYIRNLNILLAPITEKLKGKKGGITWSNEDQSALNRIIKEIESQTLLSYPDITKEFTLETDASDIGIGAVLTQGKKIIGLYSCKLLPAETRYTTAEKEFLGIIKALKHFRTIIFNVHVKIKTDHANLLFNTSVENNRVQRWKLLLEEFDYELIYQKGEENIGADGLSRICFVHLSKKGERGHRELIDLDTLKTQQESSGWHKPPNCRRDNSLGLWTDTKSRIMIPPEYANKFLSNLHRKLGHLGEKNLYMTLRDIYQIKNIRGKIQKTVRSCLRCQMGKNGSTNRGRIVGNLATDVPFRDISMDIYGPIPSDIFKLSKAEEEISKLYFLTITDRCSRFSEVYWLRTLKSEEITRILRDEWCKRHPTPTTVLTDNGRQFTSQEFAAWITTQGITHKLTCPYNPTANSLSERINQTLTKVLICEKGKDLKSILRKINWGLQQAHNRAIGGIPAVLGGVEDQIDVLKIRPPIEEEARRMHVKRQEEAETAKKNAKRKTDYQYKLGQEVKWKQPRNQKTDDFFIGPLG